MPMNTHHAHTPDCIAANENDELCCTHDIDTHDLAAFRARRVRMPRNRRVWAFTDDNADAIALVRVAHAAHIATFDSPVLRVDRVDVNDTRDPYR